MKRLALLTLAFALAACGGGGGNGDDSPPPPFPPGKATVRILNAAGADTVSALFTVGGTSYNVAAGTFSEAIVVDAGLVTASMGRFQAPPLQATVALRAGESAILGAIRGADNSVEFRQLEHRGVTSSPLSEAVVTFRHFSAYQGALDFSLTRYGDPPVGFGTVAFGQAASAIVAPGLYLLQLFPAGSRFRLFQSTYFELAAGNEVTIFGAHHERESLVPAAFFLSGPTARRLVNPDTPNVNVLHSSRDVGQFETPWVVEANGVALARLPWDSAPTAAFVLDPGLEFRLAFRNLATGEATAPRTARIQRFTWYVLREGPSGFDPATGLPTHEWLPLESFPGFPVPAGRASIAVRYDSCCRGAWTSVNGETTRASNALRETFLLDVAPGITTVEFRMPGWGVREGIATLALRAGEFALIEVTDPRAPEFVQPDFNAGLPVTRHVIVNRTRLP